MDQSGCSLPIKSQEELLAVSGTAVPFSVNIIYNYIYIIIINYILLLYIIIIVIIYIIIINIITIIIIYIIIINIITIIIIYI